MHAYPHHISLNSHYIHHKKGQRPGFWDVKRLPAWPSARCELEKVWPSQAREGISRCDWCIFWYFLAWIYNNIWYRYVNWYKLVIFAYYMLQYVTIPIHIHICISLCAVFMRMYWDILTFALWFTSRGSLWLTTYEKYVFILGPFRSSDLCYVLKVLCLVTRSPLFWLKTSLISLMFLKFDSCLNHRPPRYQRVERTHRYRLPGINISDADMSDGTRWMTLLVAASIGRLYVDPSFLLSPLGTLEPIQGRKLRWGDLRWVPSGKHTKNYGKSQFSMGKSTISTGPFSIAYMLVYQRVNGLEVVITYSHHIGGWVDTANCSCNLYLSTRQLQQLWFPVKHLSFGWFDPTPWKILKNFRP